MIASRQAGNSLHVVPTGPERRDPLLSHTTPLSLSAAQVSLMEKPEHLNAATPDLPLPEKAIRPHLYGTRPMVHLVPAPDFPSNWFGVILGPHTI